MACVVIAAACIACTRPVAAPATTAPAPPRAVNVAIAPRDEVSLRFVAGATIEVGERSGTRRVPLALQDARGPATLAASRGIVGVMVPLQHVVADVTPRSFVVQPTPECASPWLVDVDAELLVAQTRVHGVPAALRVGCGAVQHVDQVTAFGRQRVLVYGESAFDVRMVAAELGIMRTELERIFDVAVTERWLDEVVVEPAGERLIPRADASRKGLRVHVEGGQVWGAGPRLEVASTVARIWLGRLFDTIAPTRETTPERASLLHGLARGIARESLFELGLLSPDDYANDLDGAEALIAARRDVWRATGVVEGGDVAALAAARSIEAARVAWSMRAAGVAMNLPRALEDAARDDADASELWAGLAAASSPRTLGPCIVPRKVKTPVLDLGYAAPWDPQRGIEIVSTLRDDGAGAAAGMRVGDQVLAIVARDDDVHVRVFRDGRVLILDVASPPRPKPIARRGWMRRGDVADDRCYPPS